MALANRVSYLLELSHELQKTWPENRTINIVCHGHSVPAGYFRTPHVDTFHAYPHRLHQLLKERFPFAVINVIVTAIGGENSEQGEKRFAEEVLGHRPSLVTIDYRLNDRRIGLDRARVAWQRMIEAALARQVKVLLLTPTHDITRLADPPQMDWSTLVKQSAQIRELAEQYGVGVADSFQRWELAQQQGAHLYELLSQSNHPSATGHELVAQEIVNWFPLT